ncbi:DNA-binding transcriptional LysR family regulator [Microbacterium ginsengiterrae]|uniref:DNA-binding transcriptional LysR family regulator n=1 Tax=Microbacterium ginsengiterrae TaxID=546115 RepID=A0A7W9CCV6_9MICO|nr:LysR family transcriptional regulator [Microbacterium ginsengiterrae]MBB5743255.1 DNA-binding transcriptional LysR family regulator [Microbacterium ginsengiterrae]
MNLEQLRGFVAVAELGHFTRASETLHLAQPSLSRQISTLEQELGAELFHRARGNITLTAAGETLLPRARRMLTDAEAIRTEMAELAGLQRGRVRLGATPTLCISLVAEVLRSFRSVYPGVELQLVEGGSNLLIEQLAAGTVDMALVTMTDSRPVTGTALSRTALLTEELVVVSSAAEPMIVTPTIDLRGLAGLPLVALAESYDLRDATDAAFRAAGLTPSPVVEGAEMDAVLRFVERGIGVAVVPATVPVDRPSLRATRLTDPQLERTIVIAHRNDVNPTRAAAAMRTVIARTARELAARSPETLHLVDEQAVISPPAP